MQRAEANEKRLALRRLWRGGAVFLGIWLLLFGSGARGVEAQVHVVQSGENLTVIARKYGISVERLIAINGLENPDRLMPGDRLLLSDAPVVHVVQKGETLSQIAKAYGVDVRQLAVWNGVTNPDRIMPGQELVIVSEAIVHTVRAGENATTIAKKYGVTVASIAQLNELNNIDFLRVGQKLLIPPVGGSAVPALGLARPLAARRRLDQWPVKGSISSRFGMRNGAMHEGLDIAASHGTIVQAVAPGWVTYADWAGTYGMLVKIDHGSGVETRYGHNSQLLVKPGQYVRAGDPIARVGSTGRSTGPHVHFEIRVDGQPIDPLSWLP